MNKDKHILCILAEKLEATSGLEHEKLLALPSSEFDKLAELGSISLGGLYQALIERAQWPWYYKLWWFIKCGWW